MAGQRKRKQNQFQIFSKFDTQKQYKFARKYKYFLLGTITFCLVLLSQISIFTTPAKAAPISINKSFSPGTVAPGQVSTLTLQFFNSNAYSLTNTSVTNPLPTGMIVANPANITNTCGGTVNATPGNSSFSITGSTVPAQVGAVNGTCSFSVNIVTTVQGNTISTIPANSVSNNELETNNTPASATLTVTEVSAPSLSKGFAPNTIKATGNSTLSVNILNNATISLTNVNLTDNLPDNVTVNGTATKNASCGGGSVSTTATSVSLTGVTIAAGATCSFSVPVTSSVIGSYTNTIPINSITNTQGVSNAGNATANLNVQNPLTLTKSFATTPIVAGQSSTLNVNIQNTGSVSFTNVNLTDNLPTNVVAVAGTATKNVNCQGGSVSNTTTSVSLAGITILAGTTCTFSVPVTSTVLGANGASATYTNTIPANSLTNGQGYTNTSDVKADLVVNNPLTITKIFSPTPVLVNGASTLTINFANSANNPNSITGATITDTFPANLNTSGAAAKNANCGGGAIANTLNTVTLTGVTIAPGTTCTVTVPVTPTTSGNKTNTLLQNTLSTTQGYTNPTVNSTLVVNASITPPTVAKSFLTTPINLGSTSVMKLDIVNTSAASSLTNIALTDTFGTGLVVAATPNINRSAGCVGGTITATAGSNQLVVSGLTIPIGTPTTTCSIEVNVTAASAGTYNNTIPINAITNNEGVSNTAQTSVNLGVQALRATKAFSPTRVSLGQSSTLTVTLENYRVGTLMTGVAFTDTFPANVTVATLPAATTTCGGTVTANAGAGSFSLSGGSISGATNANTPGTCTVSVDVVSSTTGNKTNSIPINGVTATGGYSNLEVATAVLRATDDRVNVTKSFGTSPVNVGVPSRLTITLQVPNSNSGNSTDVALVDTLPANVVIAPITNLSFNTNCRNNSGATRSITAVAGASTIDISGVEINRNTTCTINVDVVGNINGTYTNTIPVDAVTTAEEASNPSAASDSLTVIGIPISKAFFPSTIASGGKSTLTVTINNLQTFQLTGVNLTDNLPSGVTIASPPTASTTCGAGTVSATAGNNSFTLTNGTVPQKVGAVNGICTFQVNVTSNLGSGSRTNTIPINQMTSNEGISNLVAASATLNFTALNINVNKAFNPLTVSGGSASQLTVTLSNPSLTQTYYNVSFTDNMPAGMLVASPANPVTTCTNGVVSAISNTNSFSFSGGQIPPAGSCTVTVNATSTQSGNLTNTIPIAGVTTFQGAKNTDPASASLTNLPGVGVGKSFSPNLIEPNEASLLTITVINADTLDLTNLSLTDTMPTGVTIASPANASTTCTGGTVSSTNTPNSQVTLTGASLNANSTCEIFVNVTSNTLGTYVNQIPLGTITTTQGATNPNVVADTLKIAYRPTIVKSFSPNPIPLGGVSTVTLQLGNTNAGVINLTSNLIDNLPSGLVVATPANVSGTCTLANVTATPGSSTVTYGSGSTIPAGGCDIKFDVTSSTAGTSINTIPAGSLQTDSGNNTTPATATLDVGGTPSVLFVKRITSINGGAVPSATGFLDDTTSGKQAEDNNPKWPDDNAAANINKYLAGNITNNVNPGDTVEYTVYFLSSGTSDPEDVKFCDRIPVNTSFVPNGYASGKGIILGYSTSSLADPSTNIDGSNGLVFQTNGSDGDKGQFIAAPTALDATACNSSTTNTNGAVFVNIVDSSTALPRATGSGTPPGSYGFVRFKVKINDNP